MKWRYGLFILGFGVAVIISNGTQGQPAPAAAPPTPPGMMPPPGPAPAATQQPPPPAAAAPTAAAPAAPQPPLETLLSFDANEKEVTVTNGTSEAHFSFSLTNISSGPVTVNYVQTSCGCTVAKLPSSPWTLAPKEGGEISATMQLAGTPTGGQKVKTLTVNSDKGSKQLLVKATILPDAATMTENDRANNASLAKADRQAVFKGGCIQCHVTPARDVGGHDKLGQPLYVAVCGVCHEAEHQASFVPNLHRIAEPTSADFWRNWITHGKPGSLMPAFAKAEGGILSNEQIESLVQYLTATIPSRPANIAAPTAMKN